MLLWPLNGGASDHRSAATASLFLQTLIKPMKYLHFSSYWRREIPKEVSLAFNAPEPH